MTATNRDANRQAPAPLIDQAEALVLQLEVLLIQLPDRDRNNLGHLLDLMGRAAGLREDLCAGGLEDMHAYIGPGHRVMARTGDTED
jgi:hypothetical protein